MKPVRKVALAASVFTCAALFSFSWSEQGGVSASIDSAQARVGRPLTPVSVAGVARRQGRRAAYGYGAGVVGAGVVGAGLGAAAIGTAAAVNAPYYAGGPYYGPGVVGTGLGAAAIGTAAAVRGATYSGGGPYAYYNRGVWWGPGNDINGPSCQPGTLRKMDDGLMYRCQ